MPRRRSDTVSAVGRWLAPMMAAAGDRDDINMQALFDAATTVTKMEKPKAWWRPAPFGDEEQRSVDWVLLGQLLRRALGWDDYPEAPAG